MCKFKYFSKNKVQNLAILSEQFVQTSDYSRRDMVVWTPGLLKWWMWNFKKLLLNAENIVLLLLKTWKDLSLANLMNYSTVGETIEAFFALLVG